ncbi:MAG: hypothetical protein BMS9Abin31_0125 [Gammaproteobacteria bacterium]|nr:MAG: hypothetical protein BMS9Abin31_0125 [Gammaproteobacteria bacterium]
MHKTIKRIEKKQEAITELSSVLNRVYANRNIKSENELDYSISKLLPFEQLKGIAEAAALISDAIKNESTIVIVGDFDVDGATSTTVAVKALRSMGAKKFTFLYRTGLSLVMV